MIACAGLGFGIWVNGRINLASFVAVCSPVVHLGEVPDWEWSGNWEGPWLPVFNGAAEKVAGWYAKDEQIIGIFFAAYPVQEQGREIVSSANKPEGKSGIVTRQEHVSIAAGDDSPMPFRELEVLASDGVRRLVWLSLEVAGERTSRDFVAKAYQLAGVLRGRTDARALVLTAECDEECGDARSVLTDFVIAAGDVPYDSIHCAGD